MKKYDFHLSNELNEHFGEVRTVDSYPFIKGGVLTASDGNFIKKINKKKIKLQKYGFQKIKVIFVIEL
jgi:hypothetical protein